jgi:hypothetical protein
VSIFEKNFRRGLTVSQKIILNSIKAPRGGKLSRVLDFEKNFRGGLILKGGTKRFYPPFPQINKKI